MIEGKFVALNIAVIMVLAGIYVFSQSVEPVSIEISKCGEHVGDFVRVKGVVLRVTSSGYFILSDAEFSHRVGVYDVFTHVLSPGAMAEVRGIVKKFKNGFEIIVESKDGVSILNDAYETTLPVVMNNPQRYVGLNISLSGKLSHISVTSMTVYDSTGEIYVSCPEGYSGPRSAYFLVKYRDGRFVAKAAYLTEHGSVTRITDIKPEENFTYLINGTIDRYGIYGFLIVDNYSLRFTAMCRDIPAGMATVTGKFEYVGEYGEYVLRAGNVK